MRRGTFDDLTRILVTSTSRRQALRHIAGLLAGGTVGGVVLAELSPGIALAGGGNSDCAHFCNAVFDPGPDRGQCKSDAAHGTGLCPACGNGTQTVCCPQNPDGTCTSYSSATCCSSGQVCQNGTCVTACPAGTVQLSNGSCATACSGFGLCGSCGTGCGQCGRDNSGASYCTNFCIGGISESCTTDATCPQGYYCYIGGSACMALC